MPVLVDRPTIISGHFHLIMRCNVVLFHIESVVTFCHVFDPEQFSGLTRRSMQKIFPKWVKVSEKKICTIYRYITEEEFNEIIG